MKKLTWIIAFALAAGVVVFALVASPGAVAQEEKLTFIMVPINETGIDVNGDQDLTPGDGWVSNSALRRDGVEVGRVVTSCQYMQVRADGMGGVLQCVGTAKIPGGQITTQMRFTLIEGQSMPTPVAAITGGTGRYAVAQGYVTSEPIPGSMRARVVLHLLP
jgi:hypothetical protein